MNDTIQVGQVWILGAHRQTVLQVAMELVKMTHPQGGFVSFPLEKARLRDEAGTESVWPCNKILNEGKLAMVTGQWWQRTASGSEYEIIDADGDRVSVRYNGDVIIEARADDLRARCTWVRGPASRGPFLDLGSDPSELWVEPI